MRGSNKIAGMTAALLGLALLAGPPAVNAQLVSKVESKCAGTIGKGSSKLAKTYAKEVSKCLDADISGKTVGACPDGANLDKISKASTKLSSGVVKKCASTCSVSQLPCIADGLCPPLPNIGAAEKCSAGAANLPFDYHSLGFPGAFCEAVLGGPIASGDDIGACVDTKTQDASEALIAAVYGSITNASGISAEAASCLKGISKAAQKLSSTVYKGVIKCRSSILTGKVIGNPATCSTDDATLAAKIQAAEDKLEAAINGCTDANIQELDLCLQGPGGVVSKNDAIDCLIPAVEQITDTNIAPADRAYAPSTMVEAAYPPSPACGDGAVNQVPNDFFLLGEECDLLDDSACPGNCFAPGDVYQCTCAGNEKRVRFRADGFTADLDNGWSGTSHNSGVTDKAGFVTIWSNCDCDEMTGATCTGTTGDPICDVNGKQKPTCSWDPFGTLSCDQHGGDLGDVDADNDCAICDEFASNAGSYCVDEGDCSGQCYPLTGGAPTGPCPSGQSDCASGEICRGQCLRRNPASPKPDDPTCIIIPNGAPLPISSGGTAVCIITTFREDIFGTQNIVTGEHEVFIKQYSKVHLGVNNTTPCPTCGGFCAGGFLAADVCEGTCSTTTSARCRFDEDCPGGETCTTASPECPGSYCNLSLVCNGGPNDDLPCRISAETDKFGTTSADCPPSPGQNISGNGLEINFYPQTSESVDLPATLPCTAPGYENSDCECPGQTTPQGLRTQPSKCAYACDSGLEFGVGCGSGGGGIQGFPTTCTGGSEPGAACDEDSDCSGGGTCDNNPEHCIGDPAFERLPCTSDAQCGAGTCVNACPSGRCVQLCLPADHPLFPPDYGYRPDDPEEGLCAAGPPTYHCSGAADDFRLCDKEKADAPCNATCSISGNPCSPINPCPEAEGTCQGTCQLAQVCEAGVDGILGNNDDFPGAGICIPDSRNCFVPGLNAEGGDTINGKGDPTNVRAVSTFCVPATSNNAINSTAGLGGPGRLRQNGVNVTNGFTTLP
jgi:hypothetical protein